MSASASSTPPPPVVTTRTFGRPSSPPPALSSSQTPTTISPTPLASLRSRSGSAATTTAANWLNALSDGLSWIEVQGGSVVAQAAEKGLGETLRGGLGRRPLSFSSFANGGGTSGGNGGPHAPPMSHSSSRDSSSAIDLGGSPPVTTDFLHPFQRSTPQLSTSSDASTSSNAGLRFPRVRPSSFLGLQRPTASGTPDGTQSDAGPPPSRGPPAPSNMARLGSAGAPYRASSLSGPSDHPPPTETRAHRPSLSASHYQPASTASLPTNTSIPRSSSSSATMGTAGQLSHQASGSSLKDAAGAKTGSRTSVSSTSNVNLLASSAGGGPSTTGRSSSFAAQGSTAAYSRTDHAIPRSRTVHDSLNPTASLSASAGASRSVSRSASNVSVAASPERQRGLTPYRPGYQPPGVRRSRMDAFEESRKLVAEARGREEGRLGRRWGKLLDLHFNPNPPQDPPPQPTTSGSGLSRSSSFASKSRSLLSLSMPSDITPKDVWRGLRSVSGVGVDQVAEEKRREAEMGIVKWEDDGEVKRCRICQSMFSLTNRKHHCRLCGRIVCSLPPTSPDLLALAATATGSSSSAVPASAPTSSLSTVADPNSSAHYNPRTGLPMGIRREKCSFLLVADWKTGRGEIVEEGFVGWMKVDRRGSTLVNGGGKTKGSANGVPVPKNKRVGTVGSIQSIEEGSDGGTAESMDSATEEVMVKGVRCCRECWAVVSRRQKMADRRRVSGFTRLYDAMKEVEAEIMDLLPEFQDMLLNLNAAAPTLMPPPPIPSELVALHKHILVLFTQYDALSKKIRNYPPAAAVKGLPSSLEVDVSAQRRVQEAIARSAAAFVTKEAGILQALPKLQKQRHRRAASSLNSADTTPFAFSENSGEAVAARPTSKLASEVDDELALRLQPLLEQEAMLEDYIKDANAQRKFDDAQTLRASLNDIKAEIARIASGGA